MKWACKKSYWDLVCLMVMSEYLQFNQKLKVAVVAAEADTM